MPLNEQEELELLRLKKQKATSGEKTKNVFPEEKEPTFEINI